MWTSNTSQQRTGSVDFNDVDFILIECTGIFLYLDSMHAYPRFVLTMDANYYIVYRMHLKSYEYISLWVN